MLADLNDVIHFKTSKIIPQMEKIKAKAFVGQTACEFAHMQNRTDQKKKIIKKGTLECFIFILFGPVLRTLVKNILNGSKICVCGEKKNIKNKRKETKRSHGPSLTINKNVHTKIKGELLLGSSLAPTTWRFSKKTLPAH